MVGKLALFLAFSLFMGATYGWDIGSEATQGRDYGSATTEGRRFYQEDRVLVVPDLKLSNATQTVGLFAVFDGHIGSQASEFLVTNFETQLRNNLEGKDVEQREVLEAALEKTIMELEDMFVLQAVKNRWSAGSTVAAALLTDKDKVFGHVGDSRIVACFRRPGNDHSFYALSLTDDHHPLVPEERERIERAGGVIYEGGLIDAHFPMSRAIGDVPMKRHGVIATPTISSFPNTVMENDINTVESEIDSNVNMATAFEEGYLIVATDGLYEGGGVRVSNVCQLAKMARSSFPVGKRSQAIADAALEAASRTSRDNISVVVVSLK